MLDILIIEPNPSLVTPYSLLTAVYRQPLSINRVATLDEGRDALGSVRPDLVLLSSSFGTKDTLNFLTALHANMDQGIIPLVWVVDLNQPLSQVLGSEWAGRVAVLSSVSTVEEMRATLYHVLTKQRVEEPQPIVTKAKPDDEEAVNAEALKSGFKS